MAAKILVVGALNGTLPSFLPRLSTLHSKQSFSFGIVLGDFFSHPKSIDSATGDSQIDGEGFIQKLLGNKVDIPCPLYFGLGQHPLPENVVEKIRNNGGGVDTGGEVCSNLFFLGRKGVVKTLEGVRIVAFGGVERQPGNEDGEGYTEQEAKVLRGLNGGDVLVTYEWPVGVERGSMVEIPGDGELPGDGEQKRKGTNGVREVAKAVKPRYHFVAGRGVFWEREPYTNEEGKSGGKVGTTRFIASLYAFNLDVSTTPDIPANATESPYLSAENPLRGRKRPIEDTDENPSQVGDNGSFFWGDPAPAYRGGGRRKRHRGGAGGRDENRPPPGPESCFFCLSSPALLPHHLISIGNDAYLATAKGPLPPPPAPSVSTGLKSLPAPSHVLIVPLAHSPTLSSIPDTPDQTYTEMTRFRHALEAMFKSLEEGVHTHWQVIPLPTALLPKLHTAFQEAARKDKFGEFVKRDIGPGDESAQGGEEGSWFGRRVAARILGIEDERTDWRKCVQSKEEEEDDVIRFKRMWGKWDFTRE
ncbi:CwfJ C-terminus 1-domain-containing protein-like protein [Kalaharituber pfeilii]|nr:CwfJ C-terminus 1-domain-containing protein-like protein [Kalaharituber pfeilii]